jgi:hypothetical protein
MAMRSKFNLVMYVQRPLVIDKRGGTERNFKRENGWKPVTYAGVE